MNLAISNTVSNAVVTSDDDPSFDILDLIPFTFNSKYVSGGVSVTFSFTLTAGDNFTYVGLAGHNLGTLGATLSITNHDVVDVSSFIPLDDRTLMFIIPPRSGGANDLIISITKGSSQKVIINHVAAGLDTDLTGTTSSNQVVTNDYQAGFPRIPMALQRRLRTAVTDQGAPVASLIRTVGLKAILNINNMPTAFASSDLLVFQRFWVENGFFIQNDSSSNQSYLVFNFVPEMPKAHGSTRELVNVAYSFTAYNGQ